jgi:hypothetical protein
MTALAVENQKLGGVTEGRIATSKERTVQSAKSRPEFTNSEDAIDWGIFRYPFDSSTPGTGDVFHCPR